MKTFVTTLRPAALISFVLVLPIAILELLNNSITPRNAPGLALLFGLLWLLPTAFIVTLPPVLRSARAGGGALSDPLRLLFRIALLIAIAAVWTSIVIDQVPCFLGIPNCD